jgi:hypothetical protein
MRSAIVLALALPLTALACAGTGGGSGSQAPAWLDDPYAHPEAHPAYQLAGLGMAPGLGSEAREQARRRALDAIVSEILVDVESQIDVESTTRKQDGEFLWDEALTENITLSASGELPGAEVLERWQDGRAGESHALVAVDREDLLDVLLPPVEQSHIAAVELLTQQTDLDREPTRAILNAVQAFGLVSGTFGDATRAKVVARGTPFAGRADQDFQRGSALMADASELLATVAGSMNVAITAGDDQRGTPRGSLPAPLEARFTISTSDGRSLPLVDLPVRFRSETDASPSLAAPATTDSQGKIRCRVDDLVATGRSSNRILVEVDLESLAPQLPGGRLPREAFVYRLPTPAQTAIAVSVEAQFSGRPLVEGFVGENVAGHLSERGFDVGTREGLQGLSLTDLRRALGDRYQFVVRGTANAWHSSQEQQLHLFRSQAQLEVVELSTGRIQSLTTGEQLAGHSDASEQGAIKALRQLRRPLLELLDEEFVSLFTATEG